MANGGAVRELVNKVTFKLDNASVTKVERAIDKLKRQLDTLGSGFGTSMNAAMNNTRRSIDQTALSIRRLRGQLNGLRGGTGSGGNLGGRGNSSGNSGSGINSTGLRLGNISTNNMRVTATKVFLHGNITQRGGGNSGGTGGHNPGGGGGGNNNGGGSSRGGDIASRGATMATAGAAILAPLAWATKKAADFEEASSRVQALTTLGKSPEEAARIKEGLETEAKRLGATTRFTATQSMNAMEKAAMAGWDDEQIKASMGSMLNLSIAGSTDIVEVTDIVTDGMTALGMKAEEAQRFTDAMAVAASKSNTNIHMMGETFRYAAAPAGALGYSIEDLALATGLMANAGIKESQAGTALRSTFTRMATETREAGMAMSMLGLSLTDSNGKMKPLRQTIEEIRAAFKSVDPSKIIEVEEALSGQKMNKAKKEKMIGMLEKLQAQGGVLSKTDKIQFSKMLAGQEAMSGFLAMAMVDDESYNKLANPLQNTKGAAADMAKISGANTKGDVTAALSALENFAIEAITPLLPALAQIVKAITPIIQQFGNWAKENPQLVAGIVAVIGAVGSLLAVLGTIGVFVGGIMELIAAFSGAGAVVSSIVAGVEAAIAAIGAAIAAVGAPVIAAVVAVIAIIALLVAYWDEAKEMAGNALNYMGAMFQVLLQIASNFFHAVAQFFSAMIQQIFAAANTLVSAFGSAIEAVKGFFSGLYDFAVGILSSIGSAIADFIGSKIAWAKDALGSLGNFASNIVGGIGDNVASVVNQAQYNEYNLASPSQLGSAAGASNSFFSYS